MAFYRPHPRQRKMPQEHIVDLEDDNMHLRSALETEVKSSSQYTRRIRELERDYIRSSGSNSNSVSN
ncbi:hypothetical protein C1645_826210 [Glomus cerebriforme]|uniref:Uncharacterized protein n=1 Tax=Glomus cerebriforme TaxID=658196 RepID=A0A397SXJ3_9GLOM|nr:hypothetical protein C1645_826210 [Glomus cerebriforme]